MAAQKKSAQINLLPQEQFATSISGRVLSWALSTFRIIVIITEIVVILAFLSRFFLDAQNTDLSEEITQKTDVIASSSKFEKTFRQTQKRLAIFSALTSKEELTKDLLGKIAISIPPDVFLELIDISKDTLTITGLSPNERSIQEFVFNLEANLSTESVNLSNIETSFEDSSLMEFTLNVIVKKEGV
jgi:Tfp pilus assembly protein PilN